MFAYINKRPFVIGKHHLLMSDALMKVIRGETQKLIINIAPRYGKAIDAETPMLTTGGFKKASDINIGDYLFGSDGKPTKVLARYPQGKTNAYKVTFTDGASLVTCGEHQWWAIKRRRHPNFYQGEIVKTKELINNLYQSDGHRLWHIPSCSSLQSSSILPINPYLFGCWLGDGSTYKAEITTMDDSIRDAFSEYGLSVRKHQNAGRAITYGIRGGFITQLRNLGVVGHKRIPECYLLASEESRWSLLMGICDTDGTCNRKNGQTSVCLTKDDLRDDLKTLLASLGIFYTEYRNSIFFRSSRCPFKLQRKSQYWKPANKHHFTKRFITSIEQVEDRETICFTVDAKDHLFCAGKELILTHNTELISRMFVAYGFALNPTSKYLHISYSGNLVSDNSMAVKDIIMSEYFQNCFDVRFKYSENTRTKWSTTAGGGEYATSTLGQITGFGAGQPDLTEEIANIDEFTAYFNPGHFAGAIVIDDPLRPEDALSDIVRESVNRRFETTIRNRVNSRKTPIIIVMQRLHEHDLCGYLQEIEPKEWDVLSIPVISVNEQGEEEALWPFKHTLEELYKIKNTSDFVFETQYMQNPTPMEGLMYHQFKTYDILPNRRTAKFRGNYTDSADTGFDYLCSINFDVHDEGYYITNILYTKKPMEYTEQAMAQMVCKDETDIAWVESNNGGRTFMRNVERITRSYENRKTRFVGFTQTRNKQIRIFTLSGEVNNMIIFPSNWEQRWPEFAHGVKTFRKEGINAHDDHVDALTGIIEKAGEWGIGASDKQILKDFL